MHEDHRQHAIETLRRCADLHDQARLDQFDAELGAFASALTEITPPDSNLGLVWAFCDEWLDARQHDWQVHGSRRSWSLRARRMADEFERRGRLFKGEHCPECGYDIRAHPPGQACPECGVIV